MVYYDRRKLLFDTCALVRLAEALPKIPEPLIISDVHRELRTLSQADVCNHLHGDMRKDNRESIQSASVVARFYDAHPEYTIPPVSSSTLHKLTPLTGKQIAWDLGKGIIFQEKHVLSNDLTDVGKTIGQTLLQRVKDLGIVIDEHNSTQLIRVALDSQKYILNCVRKHHGKIQEPKFDTDLLILATARHSPVYSGCETWVVSYDCDIKHINWFAEKVRDRFVKFMHPERFLAETGLI